MEDRFKIDSHKLMFHISRVDDWLKDNLVCPIYLEIAPAGGCNHRCIFCALDYLKYRPDFIDSSVLKKTIKSAKLSGVKSIMYAGEGEPLLHKEICDIIRYTKNSGIDTAVTTNGVLLEKDTASEILRFLTWIRISLNAGTDITYSKIHRADKGDFHKVTANLKQAVKIKHKHKLAVTIGVQLLLIPDNANEVLRLAKLLKDIGADYFTIKPYSRHPLSNARIDPASIYRDYAYLGDKLKKTEDRDFKVVFRNLTMDRLNREREYRHCLGAPFWAYINAQGDVYACSAFLGKKEFCYGNIYKRDFKGILESGQRRKIVDKMSSLLNTDNCRRVCRMDKINAYLWELTRPNPHVNFI